KSVRSCLLTLPTICASSWSSSRARLLRSAWTTYARKKDSQRRTHHICSPIPSLLTSRSRQPKLSQQHSHPRSRPATSTVGASRANRTNNNNGPANTPTREVTPTNTVTVTERTPAARAMTTATAAVTGLLFTGKKEKTPGGTVATEDAATPAGPRTDS
ncbi:hypothetical protein BGZ75_002423, partial [Mortierella antarctica]